MSLIVSANQPYATVNEIAQGYVLSPTNGLQNTNNPDTARFQITLDTAPGTNTFAFATSPIGQIEPNNFIALTVRFSEAPNISVPRELVELVVTYNQFNVGFRARVDMRYSTPGQFDRIEVSARPSLDILKVEVLPTEIVFYDGAFVLATIQRTPSSFQFTYANLDTRKSTEVFSPFETFSMSTSPFVSQWTNFRNCFEVLS